MIANQNRYSFLLFILLIIHTDIFAQKPDSTNVVSNFGGSVTINTKGISTIPNLTLGKPAAIFAMTVGRKISFDPELRFALEGKPWSFIFWWHYQILNTKKFQIRTGINPSVYFKPTTITLDSTSNNILSAKRSLTGDLSVSYSLAKYFTIGPYYMYIRNFDQGMPANTHFLSLRGGFSNINFSKQFYMRFNPQLYYLKIDKNDGFYFNATLTLLNHKFPVSVSALINKAIKTKISAGEDFLWNVGLIYSFNRKYVEKR
jgi:hypothetical protein